MSISRSDYSSHDGDKTGDPGLSMQQWTLLRLGVAMAGRAEHCR